jgi:hypothetical protein
MSRRAVVADRGISSNKIEITPEMIAAGSAVLCREESLDLGCGFAELLTRRVLSAALGIPDRGNPEVD